MKYETQIDLLNNDLANIIYRYKSEYDLHDETIIGCIEACKMIVLDSTEIDFESDMDLDDDKDNKKDS